MSESKKCKFSTHMLRILVPSIINCVTRLSSRNIRSRNCASSPREVWEITYILPTNGLDSLWDPPRTCGYAYLTVHNQHSNYPQLHTLDTFAERMRFGTCSKERSHFSRSCVHSASKKTYINLSVSLLGFSGARQQKWPDGCFLFQ